MVKQARSGAMLKTALSLMRGADGKPLKSPPSYAKMLYAVSELRRRTGGTHVAWLVGAPLIQLPMFVTAMSAGAYTRPPVSSM